MVGSPGCHSSPGPTGGTKSPGCSSPYVTGISTPCISISPSMTVPVGPSRSSSLWHMSVPVPSAADVMAGETQEQEDHTDDQKQPTQTDAQMVEDRRNSRHECGHEPVSDNQQHNPEANHFPSLLIFLAARPGRRRNGKRPGWTT